MYPLVLGIPLLEFVYTLRPTGIFDFAQSILTSCHRGLFSSLINGAITVSLRYSSTHIQPLSKETTLKRADFALQLLMFVNA